MRAASLTIWLNAGRMKSANWISGTGRSPLTAAPIEAPTISDSVSGVSITRSGPNSANSPSVARKTPPFTPTSSPRTITPASRRISLASVERMASMNVWTAISVLRGLRLGVDVSQGGRRIRLRLSLRPVGRVFDGGPDLRRDRRLLLVVQQPRVPELLPKPRQRVACALRHQLLRRAVLRLLIVRGVRRQPCHLGLDERGAVPSPSPVDRFAAGPVAGKNVAAIHHHAGEAVRGGAIGDVGDGALEGHRDADGISVVLDDEHDGKPVHSGEVQPLVEVALVAGALAELRERDLPRPPDLRRQRDPDGVQQLRGDGRARGQDVVLGRPVVAGHLPSAGGRVVGARELRHQDVARGHAEREDAGDRAVVRNEPVEAGPERRDDPHLRALVALAADDERSLAGAVEDPHPLVDRPGQRDEPVHAQEVLVHEAMLRRQLAGPDRRLGHGGPPLGSPRS